MSAWIVTEGQPEPLGVTADAAGINVAVFSAHADAIVFCLFDEHGAELSRIALPARTGDVFHGHILGVGVGARYGLRAFGSWDPSRGHRFNPAKLLLDPYATAIDRPFHIDATLFDVDRPNAADSAAVMPKGIIEPRGIEWPLDTDTPARPPIAWDRLIIYEAQVRGFTMRHPDIPPALRGTFAGLAHPAAIAHLKQLGVTAIELMPAAAWLDERHLPPLGRSNYWGYNPVALLAPDPRLAPGGWAEIRAAVAVLQAAGIAVLLDVVLNHAGEGDELGPTVSLRGLDNASYYRLQPNDGARYVNDTGCGNMLAVDRPPVVRLAMAALRTWAVRAGIDGFRLDLATTLGRRPDGFDPAAPLLTAMTQDPVLSDRVIIAEPWDVGPGGYQLGAFPAAWGEWNDRFRDNVRRFWRGDAGMLGDLATQFAGSADIFAGRHRPLSRSINFVTAHDGFTMADLVAYTAKRNEANGEANRDGTDANFSWNNGVEGPTTDPKVGDARVRDVRALLATLLLSRGTPMMSMGDEAGRSQHGNNNAYAQDNETAWFDWAALDHGLLDFTGRLTRARLEHKALTGTRELTGRPVDGSELPDVAWLRPDGKSLAMDEWHDPQHRTLVVSLYVPDSRVIVVLHAGTDGFELTLPSPRPGQRWQCIIDSAAPDRTGGAADRFPVAARSVVLLAEADDQAPCRRSGVASADLQRLAEAAGIAPVWWDVEGHEHRIGDDTKRALLAAMRLPASTQSEFADSIARLTTSRELASLPPALVVREGEPVTVPLGPLVGATWLSLQREDGSKSQFPTMPGATRQVRLPPMPVGRHRLWLDETPEVACHLTVAPGRCFLPPDLTVGQRRFGVAAQLYTLRRQGDQGIGDFTTLARLANTAASHGAAVVGINPLHALFPGDRDRASPYNPSDRRFLDPIYIDVAGLPGVDGARFGDLAASDAVDYPRVWAAKRAALQAAFDAGGSNEPGFVAYVAAGGGALREFAIFEAISEAQASTNWLNWPEGLRHPHDPAVADFAAEHADRVRFAAYLQYLADRQFAAAATEAERTGQRFYRDLAVGAAPDGAEAWCRQDALLRGISVGAPPDPFSPAGQVWSLPAPDPRAMAREGYAGFAELLAANMRHAGALRIDHAMGLQRLFLVPDGASAHDGAYLAYPLQDLLGQVALESHRAKWYGTRGPAGGARGARCVVLSRAVVRAGRR
jgi:glycogen debranching enzyme GlgX